MGCCHEKNICIDTNLIEEDPPKVSPSPSNQLTASKEESHQVLQPQP